MVQPENKIWGEREEERENSYIKPPQIQNFTFLYFLGNI